MFLLEGDATESPIPHTAPEVAHVYAWTVYDKLWLQTFLLMKEHSYTAHFYTWVNTGRKKVILIQDYSITTSIAHTHPSSFWWSTLHIGWHHQRLHKSCQCFQCYCPPKTTMGSANCFEKNGHLLGFVFSDICTSFKSTLLYESLSTSMYI